MSIYLMKIQLLQTKRLLAGKIELSEVLVSQQTNYWIEINKNTGKNFYEERYWTYN
ncbi:MAG: hypothetical protein Q4A42_02155 [Tissierellia bacterium]|nr:hypothetical protein [Tissierellia bacterium]